MESISKKKEYIVFSLFVVLFVVLHLWGVSIPYHQDEYKWVFYTHPEFTSSSSIPHPPLTEFIYTKLGPMFGDNNFRFIPFIFGFINLFLIFWLAQTIFKIRKTTLWVTGLFTVSFFSLLATLMVDVDGAIMAFFFLLLSIGYVKAKETQWKDWKWFILILIGAIGGFLVKVSAILPIMAFAIDFAIEKDMFSDRRKVLKYSLYFFLGAIFLFLVLFFSKYIFPFFNLKYSLSYWGHFLNSSSFLDRGWFQTFIQVVKSLLYASPLLLAPLFFIDKDIWKKTRGFFIFIFCATFFYIVIFDFSIGALDRYLQFMIIPLCLVSGAIYSKYLNGKINKKSIIVGITISIGIFCLQFLHHFTPPLYPKAEWLHRLVSFKWNFLYPFSGGSGPLPFYISFVFMALFWIASFVLIILFFKKRNWKKEILICVFIFGFVYNAVFIEEYLFGKINGSARKLVADSVEFIKNDNNIDANKKVVVYNDNGGFNVQQTGKYRKRLYIDPKFGVESKMDSLNYYKEFYMVVDIPHIDQNSFYAKYFNSCSSVFTESSGVILVHVYDCRKAPDIK